MPVRMQNLVALTALAIGAMVATTAHAQKKYDPGASDTEIKLGQTMPYSGPLSSFATLLGCDPKTIRQGQHDLEQLPDGLGDRVRKKGADASGA